jgi:hypothetical protein
MAGCGIVGECLAQLLNYPSTGRAFGHIAVQDAPPVSVGTVKKSIAAMAPR